MGHAKSNPHKPDLLKHTKDDSKRTLLYGVAAMKGWRKFMEDTYLTIMNFQNHSDIDLFAIFDGHGGSQVAIFVQQEFPKQLAKNDHFLSGNYSQALRQTFIQMDHIIQSDYGVRKLEEIIEQEDLKGNCKNLFGQSIAGCTALVCLVTCNKIFVANAGDSKGIAFVSKQCIPINTEHKPTLHEQQMRIRLAGGFVQYGRILGEINISRCLGDLNYKNNTTLQRHEQMIISDPEILQVQKQNCEYILMGSDGIWQQKTNQMMHMFLSKLSPHLKLSQKLCLLFDDEVSTTQDSQEGKDNMTAILIQFH